MRPGVCGKKTGRLGSMAHEEKAFPGLKEGKQVILLEQLKEFADDTIIYVGAANGFLFGGTKTEFMQQVPALDEGFKEALNLKIDKQKNKLEKLSTGKIRTRDEAELKKREQKIAVLQEEYAGYVSLLHREVKDCYARITESTAIIIKGNEIERVWDRSKDRDLTVRIESETGAENLANAIIKTLCLDYAAALVNKKQEQAVAIQKYAMEFDSPHIQALCLTDTKYLKGAIEKDPGAVIGSGRIKRMNEEDGEND